MHHQNSPEALLQQWIDEEAAVRTRLAEPGLARPDQIKGRTGLQVMQAMLDGELPPPHIAKTLDFTLISVADGEAVFQGRPLLRHYNPLGSVHGGWFATLLDSALGCAVHTKMEPGRGYTTLEFKVNLVRALSEKVPLVRAIGTVTHSGRQVATSEARLVGHDGKLYAHASTTCLVFDLPQ
ncbi:PaaI family thioesterase [Paucibacter sp. O1-1]|uniref:PaaI family thioesterase n=1 Tax=unclassified Roseateles TaxID=2626991 RepID=UPI0021D4A806|nr:MULTISPECIES: PaaI family thioesterase [unclassified Roseateles]MCU7375419.1 PaaI family thioesterase [Paucibacter sp. O1-1]MCZ7884590.1 PaaI family thioesterase [Paucibacter sp. M5-1]MDA3830426.1 PaaI family thioesterase [Paucibacter sp. O1-1]MDC6165836.1 PaaI family thioesterase [Paucibacter sp. XJ19-41]